MNLREATADDVEAIRSIARSSLSESYSHFLDEETIDDAVTKWYGDSLADDLEDDDVLIVIAEADADEQGAGDGDAIGFSQSEFVGEGHNTGQILWIHVDPEHRGSGTGVRLLSRTREELLDTGADHIRATVLEDNEAGNEFYETHGFERAGTLDVEIGGETFTENVYVESDFAFEGDDVSTEGEPSDQGPQGWRAIQEVDLEAEDGSIYVSYGEAVRGSKAPFYTAYESAEGSQRYGWFCGNCDSLDNAMDSMGQVECNACGNRRKATRWDASYL